jgi:two-component system sensor histidine kinase YesM
MRNKSSIVNVIQDIQKVIIMAIFVFMVLSAYMAYRISLKMTRPINDMIVSAQSISWSNLDMKTLEGNDENEIMALNNTFKETLKRLSKSMQLELGARLNALQSQMNPHFLYNTLSVISASADQQEKVERMCSRLSDMLRYSTVYEEESNSTLEDEVRHTENYLELMKDRYEENLIYNIEEAGELERVKVPRVILQPIVENCFKHGFGQNGFPWIIHVAVTASHGHWRIHVRNNGRPFQERDLTELNEKVEGFLKGEQKKISGIGLTNTIIRLRLLYEEQVEYEIYTGNDGYTYVVLKGNYK